jgi:hypothetical protein
MNTQQEEYFEDIITGDALNEDQALWDKLTMAQQFSVCSLSPFGYSLTHGKVIAGKFLALMTNKDKVASIDFEGVINTSAKIYLKHR